MFCEELYRSRGEILTGIVLGTAVLLCVCVEAGREGLGFADAGYVRC